jgi:hypothetical protein
MPSGNNVNSVKSAGGAHDDDGDLVLSQQRTCIVMVQSTTKDRRECWQTDRFTTMALRVIIDGRMPRPKSTWKDGGRMEP